ncbi:MAG: glycosyltransferase family 2 protein [Acidobacteria bacterium]|nr:glycosyltransferase family 2 protein [Candidatus Sulfomarinibacter kjeldsenii]MBD3855615.1 glycosyltransferase family 2 protein [Candidatus Sulfomarinibacter kjeldsenii]
MISVIIVNHDGEAHIGRCLASLDGSGAEVLLVDNASRDNSLSLVQERFPEVKIFSQEENLGFAAANNLAAAKANGEALLLLNADAWLEAGALDLLEEKLNTRPDVGLVAPRLRYPDGRRQFSWAPARGFVGEVLQKARNPFEAQAWAHGSLARWLAHVVGPTWYTAACVLVRAEAFRAFGGFDESFFMYFEDVDLCLRLEAAGWRLAQEPRAVVCHAGGVAGRSEVDDLYRPSQLRYYRLHRPQWERRFVERRMRRRYGDAAVDRWLTVGRGR